MNEEELRRQVLKILREEELISEPEECKPPVKEEILQILLEDDRLLDVEVKERRHTNVVFLFSKPDDAITGVLPRLQETKRPSFELAPAHILIPFALLLAAICAGLSLDGFSVMPLFGLCCGVMTAWFVLQIRKKGKFFNEVSEVLSFAVVKGGIYLPGIELARYIGLFSK